ncbi:uncharacterized protein EI97DRAFT_102505 [Westerdykella ornata]|uniref:Nudix hydrolase domain-containing protein n=1 Tax=Westerdykella ornata TaxID=318751 RepID=A0A6A6JDR6_WESOR|nr:uncharacterized protein EI97DRAFT_102505 [Westerdykella ornata]KAF2274562.1 hypothetical protein EI97DRAFT_102505 [Westerdykella ornata]
MAQSTFTTRQYTSKNFVESCGAVLFDLASPTLDVCLLHHLKTDEWYLPKGRRNQSESRRDAAVREVMEETGYRCHIYPVRMATRAPSTDDPANVSDKVRIYPHLTEPFRFTMRELDSDSVKLIWWYIAALDDGARSKPLVGETAFKAEFFSCDEAVEKLTFQTDREVLLNALKLVGSSKR